MVMPNSIDTASFTCLIGDNRRTFIAPHRISQSYHIIGYGYRNQNTSPVRNLDEHKANVLYLSKIKKEATTNRVSGDKTSHSKSVVESLYREGYSFVRWNGDLKNPLVHPLTRQVILGWLVYETEEARVKVQQALKCQANQVAAVQSTSKHETPSQRFKICLQVRKVLNQRLRCGADLNKPLEFEAKLPATETKSFNVICGRGVNPAEHPGNSALRALVEDSAPIYGKASSNKEKEQVVLSIWGTIQYFGGEFIDRKGVLVPEKKVKRDMIGQRLRDCLRNSKRSDANVALNTIEKDAEDELFDPIGFLPGDEAILSHSIGNYEDMVTSALEIFEGFDRTDIAKSSPLPYHCFSEDLALVVSNPDVSSLPYSRYFEDSMEIDEDDDDISLVMSSSME